MLRGARNGFHSETETFGIRADGEPPIGSRKSRDIGVSLAHFATVICGADGREYQIDPR